MRRHGIALTLVLFVAITVSATFTGPATSAAEAPPAGPEPVGITVELTRDIDLAQSLPWVEAFLEPSLTTVRQRAVSSAQARRHLLAGEIDAAVVGTPATKAERDEAKIGATIEVPIHVSTTTLLMSEPYSPPGFVEATFLTAEQNTICGDPQGDDFDPEICIQKKEYTGPVRVPHANLAAMMFAVDDLRRWRHPDVMAAMGVPNLNSPPPDAFPTFVHREPGESVNFYVQKYATISAPAVWEKAKLAHPGQPYEVDESVQLAVATRNSPTNQALQVANWQNNPGTGTASEGWAGNIADITPAAALQTQQTFPDTPFRVIEMKNGADQWVAPTPNSISKAVAAGGTKPLYALDHKVDGGYPLVWVDNLMVAAKGLSPEKTNAVAGFVRFVATKGQAGAAALGEGKLSPALVTEALNGADAIVKSNCVGDDVRVVSTDKPDPYAAPALATAGLGKMASCQRVTPEAAPEPPAAPPPDTSAPAETPLDPLPDLPPSSEFDGALGSGGGSGALTAAPVAGAPAAKAEAKRAPTVKLPYAVLAASGRSVDRLATLLLGALLLLVARATIWPRISKRLG